MTKTLSRRTVVGVVAVAPLAGCSFLQKVSDVDMSKVASEIAIISGAVTSVKNGLGKISTIPSTVKAEVVTWIDDALAVASKVTSAVSSIGSQPFVVRLEDDLKAALIAGKKLLPTTASGLLTDGLTLLNAVKGVIGLASLIPAANDPNEVVRARMRLQAAAIRGTI